MDYLSSMRFNANQISLDAMAKLRTSNATTLHDGKSLNFDRTLLWENVGTGTGTFANNMYDMAVTSGQWRVRQTRRFFPYYSGKSQAVELTLDNFATEANVIKRVGYFSSNAVSPFASTYDGFWLEDDGITKRFITSKAGTIMANVALADWNGEYDFSGYNWNNFTVIKFDFLWLGGAILRMFIDTPDGFKLAHTHIHAGTATGTFTNSPNQPVRYEIRSTTGVGSMRMICSEVESEGSTSEAALARSVYTSSPVNVSAVGVTYPILSLRKNSAYRDISVTMHELWAYVTSNNDQAIWTLQINPTLSAGLTYTTIANSAAQYASGNGTITVTSPGTILDSGAVAQGESFVYTAEDDFLSFLGGSIANVMDEYIFCVTPITANITIYAGLSYLEY